MIVRILVAAVLLLVACTPLPDAVRPTIEWFSGKGLACEYHAPIPDQTDLAQWSCRARDGGTTHTVVVDGNEKGVFTTIAQVQAQGTPIDLASAQAFFEETAIPAPLNRGNEVALLEWLRANPGGDVTTIGGIRVLFEPGSQTGAQITTLSFTYPRP